MLGLQPEHGRHQAEDQLRQRACPFSPFALRKQTHEGLWQQVEKDNEVVEQGEHQHADLLIAHSSKRVQQPINNEQEVKLLVLGEFR